MQMLMAILISLKPISNLPKKGSNSGALHKMAVNGFEKDRYPSFKLSLNCNQSFTHPWYAFLLLMS